MRLPVREEIIGKIGWMETGRGERGGLSVPPLSVKDVADDPFPTGAFSTLTLITRL